MSKIPFNIGDIIISKNPYPGETPLKFTAYSSDNYTVVWLNTTTFKFDENSYIEYKPFETFEDYKKVNNLDEWLYYNKQSVINRKNIVKLESLLRL